MIRELVLVAADLKAAPWHAGGAAPRPPTPPEISFRTDMTDTAVFAGGPVSADTARRRFAGGDRCVMACESAKLVGQLWLSREPRHIDWIGCDVAPAPGHVLLYNAWVAPAWRGRNVHWAMASIACETALGMAADAITAGVERGEFEAFAHKYAEMGLAVIRPTASLWCLRLGTRRVRLTLPPPALLRFMGGEIAKRFEAASCA